MTFERSKNKILFSLSLPFFKKKNLYPHPEPLEEDVTDTDLYPHDPPKIPDSSFFPPVNTTSSVSTSSYPSNATTGPSGKSCSSPLCLCCHLPRSTYYIVLGVVFLSTIIILLPSFITPDFLFSLIFCHHCPSLPLQLW